MILGFKDRFVPLIEAGQKVHTVRKGDRWRAGMSIQMATGVRTKDYHCFREDVCDGVQEFRMENGLPIIDESPVCDLGAFEQRDGLKIGELFDWFPDGFTGQVIHWTPGRYIRGVWVPQILR